MEFKVFASSNKDVKSLYLNGKKIKLSPKQFFTDIIIMLIGL